MKGKFFENLSEILNRSCYINKFQAIQMNAKIIHTELLCGFVYVHHGSHTTFFRRTTLQELYFYIQDSTEENWSERYLLWLSFLSCFGRSGSVPNIRWDLIFSYRSFLLLLHCVWLDWILRDWKFIIRWDRSIPATEWSSRSPQAFLRHSANRTAPRWWWT